MYQTERLGKIMEILNKYGYVTVKYLTYKLDYSTATVNRDLNILEQKNLIKRSYGGVELIENKSVPLLFRYSKMGKIKNSIAKKAVELIKDGDTVFIDGSTTTEAMGRYLTSKKNITVITNNIALVLYLNEYNIDAVNLGGRIKEVPYISGGSDTEENAMKYKVDKMFFSSSGITKDGEIQADEEYETLRRIMHKNSVKAYYLVDSEKILPSIKKVLFTPRELDGIISNYVFSDEVKALYPRTEFIETKPMDY